MQPLQSEYFHFNPLRTAELDVLAWNFAVIMTTNKARELFQPSKEAESLLTLILKNLGALGFERFLM